MLTMSQQGCAAGHAMISDTETPPRPAAANRARRSTQQMSDTRFVSLNGHRVAYRDEGDPAAETLLLIHGVAGSSLAWVPLFEHLSARYRVVAPDLLGHGQSDKPRADYSLGAFAVWLRDFLDALDIPEATLVGHSLGGGVALQHVYQHRQYCRRLVLVNSGGLGTDVSMSLRLLSTPALNCCCPSSHHGRRCSWAMGFCLCSQPGESSRRECRSTGKSTRRWRIGPAATPSCGHCGPLSTFAARRSARWTD